MIIMHDHRLPCEYVNALEERLPDCILKPLDMSALNCGYQSIQSHPDIYFFQIGQNVLIHAPSVPRDMLEELEGHGVRLIAGESNPGCVYPQTAMYNVVRVGQLLFSNAKYIDLILVEKATELSLETVHVEQGYARCSVIPVGGRAMVTADLGIASTAERKGIDTLRISPGCVHLPGEASGFIGGACGVMPDDSLILLGDISFHPDADRIKDFLSIHNVELIDMPGLPLYDAGSLIICG